MRRDSGLRSNRPSKERSGSDKNASAKLGSTSWVPSCHQCQNCQNVNKDKVRMRYASYADDESTVFCYRSRRPILEICIWKVCGIPLRVNASVIPNNMPINKERAPSGAILRVPDQIQRKADEDE